MYKGKKISVAMATYNGEKFIEEQLLSILNQTVPPDEIIISDDGSKDKTLEIVNKIAADAECEIAVMTDNPHHGMTKNFEWAVTHTSGDYIFLSDQDDIWMEDKVEKVIGAFLAHPDAELVVHDAVLIKGTGEIIDAVFSWVLSNEAKRLRENEVVKISRDKYLMFADKGFAFSGMSICIDRRFAESAVPFCDRVMFHDGWLTFSAFLDDAVYYVNARLTNYRLHGDNNVGLPVWRGNLFSRIKQTIKRIKRTIIKIFTYDGQYLNYAILGAAKKRSLEKRGYKKQMDYDVAAAVQEVCELAEKLYKAETAGRIAGAVELTRLYKNDNSFRSLGVKAYLAELAYILLYSKKYRTELIERHMK